MEGGAGREVTGSGPLELPVPLVQCCVGLVLKRAVVHG